MHSESILLAKMHEVINATFPTLPKGEMIAHK